MATLPDTYARRPSPRFGGVDQAAPADTRVVQDGDIALGQGISQFGSAMTNFFIKEQIEEDNNARIKSMTKLKQRINELTIGKEVVQGPDSLEGPSRSVEGGYRNVKGGNIDDQFFNTEIDKLDQAINEIASELTNADQQRMFKQYADLARINHTENLINHVTEQKEIERQMTYEAGIATSIETMALNTDNGNVYQQEVDSIRRSTEAYAKRHGITGEAKEMMVLNNLSAGHLTAINAALKDDRFRTAEEIMDLYGKEEMTAEHRLKAAGWLDETGQLERAQEFMDKMRSTVGDDFKKMRDIARDTLDGDDRANALTMINAYEVEQGKEKRSGQIAASDSVYDAANDLIMAEEPDPLTTIQKTMVSELDAMEPTERARFVDWLKSKQAGTTVKTDWGAFFYLERYIRDNQEDAQKNLRLETWSHRIGGAELKELNRMVWTDPKTLLTNSQLIDEALHSFDMDPADLEDYDGDDGEKARAFRRYLHNQLPADWNTKDLEQVIAGSKKQIMSDGGFWTAGKFYAWEVGLQEPELGVNEKFVVSNIEALEALDYEPTQENLQYAEMVRVAGKTINRANIEAVRAAEMKKLAEQKAGAQKISSEKDATRAAVERRPAASDYGYMGRGYRPPWWR